MVHRGIKMAKVTFLYGTMNVSKSAQLLMKNYNYLEAGITPLLISPAKDTRYGYGVITSRVGLEAKSHIVDNGNLSYAHLSSAWNRLKEPPVIMVDEAQFIGIDSVKIIEQFSRDKEIDLLAFGLLKDFKNNLFPASKTWLELSDKFVEISTNCVFCSKKATRNLRMVKGVAIQEGDSIAVGNEGEFHSVCATHYDMLTKRA